MSNTTAYGKCNDADQDFSTVMFSRNRVLRESTIIKNYEHKFRVMKQQRYDTITEHFFVFGLSIFELYYREIFDSHFCNS